ncbi:hypothetical protein EX169_10665 [Listeria monocytogenes]|nr:hypothetical protein [Listeria monocytogenes]EAF3638072.1 hypothetical protein [Listeria monocytogenes]EAF4774548.1 hypothetical protein [Listeria monocytogenes]
MANKHFKIGFGIIILILIADYFNAPSAVGLNMMNINWSLFNILVVIILYLLTFKNIEARTILKEKNKENIVNELLKECYLNINDTVKSLQSIKNLVNEDNIDAVMNIAFPNDNLIQNLIKDGLLTDEELMYYLSIKANFNKVVSLSRFLNLEFEGDLETDIEEVYDSYKTELKKLVKLALDQLAPK